MKSPSRDLAEVIRSRTQSSSPVTYIPYDQAYEPGFEDMLRRVPSLEKLEKLANFRPQTTLPEIIDRVAEHLDPRRNRDFVRTRQAATAAD